MRAANQIKLSDNRVNSAKRLQIENEKDVDFGLRRGGGEEEGRRTCYLDIFWHKYRDKHFNGRPSEKECLQKVERAAKKEKEAGKTSWKSA